MQKILSYTRIFNNIVDKVYVELLIYVKLNDMKLKSYVQ